MWKAYRNFYYAYNLVRGHSKTNKQAKKENVFSDGFTKPDDFRVTTQLLNSKFKKRGFKPVGGAMQEKGSNY